VEILKQPQYKPMPVDKQILLIFAGTNGYLEMYPESVLQRYEQELTYFAENQHPEVYQEIREKKALDADLEKKIKNLLEEFKGNFKAE
jgi:F-type H+-transporting ATPase subunit alpha